MMGNSSRLIAAFVSVIFLLLLVTGTLAQVSNQIERVSVASNGAQGNEASLIPSISADGRYVAFESYASNLVAGDTNVWWDVFVHDRQTGQTTRVSVSSNGTQANYGARNPSISGDGRYVAFVSIADNLVAGDTFGVWDVFVHDRQTGQTTRVSVASNGTQSNYGSWGYPSISADGRYVAFESDARNMVAGDTNNATDIFVHDRQTGQTTRVSVASNGAQANDDVLFPSISADGRYVVFESDATNLVAGDTNDSTDIFIRDRQTGQTTRVSVASNGAQANDASRHPSISIDGRYVVFESDADNLVAGDTNGSTDIFVRDRQTAQTMRVSVAANGGQAGSHSHAPSISADGRYVAFESFATNLVAGDTVGANKVFVRDRQTAQTTLVAIAVNGALTHNQSAISADGGYVAFESDASNLVTGDTNGDRDIFAALNALYTPASSTITNLSFQQQQITNPNVWDAVGQNTVDGNVVRINVSINNPGSIPQTLHVQFTDAEGDALLPVYDAVTNTVLADSTATFVAQPGNNTFQVLWDTSGYAWNDDHTPHSNRQVKVILKLNGAEVSTLTSPIKVIPKPIIFVHGLDSNASTWTEFKDRVTDFNPDWHGFAVDTMITDRIILGSNNSLPQNAEELDDYIRNVRTNTRASHVDIVAHSMGGLISRYYIQNSMGTLTLPSGNKPVVSHLMMLGTPNWGSPCASLLVSLNFLQPSSGELMPEYLRDDFNPKIKNQRGVPFYILAGGSDDVTCSSFNPGDFVVETISAITGIEPGCRIIVPTRKHTEMTSGLDFAAIRPILAIGPTEAAQPPGCGASSTNSFSTPPPAHDPQVYISLRVLNVPAGGMISVDVPVDGDYKLRVEVGGAPVISTLLDPGNVVVSTIDNSNDQSSLPVATHRIDNPALGTWKLQISNPSSLTAPVAIGVYVRDDPVKLQLGTGQSPSPMPALAQPNPVPKPLVAALAENDVPITNAVVTAEFTNYNGAKTTRSLTHQDGGVYGLQNPNLAPGTYWVNLTATTPNWTRTLVTVWIVEPDTGPILSYYTTLTPTLTWNRLSWALSYELQVDETSDFASPLEYSAIVNGLQETTSQLAHGVHYWRVRGCSLPGVCGKWSEPERFEVDVP